ncbi:MAG: anthranilate phosphoribosyltransferase [Bacillota bacterium]
MITDAIRLLVDKHNLSTEMMEDVFQYIMDGKASDVQIGSFLTALTMKGETIDEISAAAKVLRDKSERIQSDKELIDIVGTGGDMANTFNISTVSAIITAASGAYVSKHGNRSASSNCGSADVLEALGVNLNASPEHSEKMLNEVGLCFMYAPVYHSSMKYVSNARKEIKIRTIFNILGPLSNPAKASRMLLGVFDKALVRPLAEVLSNLGIKRAMVVHGFDHLDEITLTDKTYVSEVRDHQVIDYVFDPLKYGFTYTDPAKIQGGDKTFNKHIILSILEGEKSPKRDISILNSGVSIYLYNDDITLNEAFDRARASIDSKKALNKLNELIEVSHAYDS